MGLPGLLNPRFQPHVLYSVKSVTTLTVRTPKMPYGVELQTCLEPVFEPIGASLGRDVVVLSEHAWRKQTSAREQAHKPHSNCPITCRICKRLI